MQYEYKIKFFIFGKPYQTTIVAESKPEAIKKFNAFILSKVEIASFKKDDSELNDAVDEFRKIFDSFKK